MEWYFWIGLIGSIGISIFTLPQLINLFKTKNTAFINIPMYLIYLIGCFCFLVGGILMLLNTTSDSKTRLSSGLPLIIAQSICGIISLIIFIWKMINYFGAKSAGISELEYIEKFKRRKNND